MLHLWCCICDVEQGFWMLEAAMMDSGAWLLRCGGLVAATPRRVVATVVAAACLGLVGNNVMHAAINEGGQACS